MFPERYTDPMAWLTSRAGTTPAPSRPRRPVKAIGDMLRFRAKGATLFLVVDEVSQYVHQDKAASTRLRAFASALGSRA
jgi:hypothetical protein